MSGTPLDQLKGDIRRFEEGRGWGGIHSPKSLAVSVTAEAQALVDVFEGLSAETSENLDEETLSGVKDEIGDVLIYLVMLADRLGVDLVQAGVEKLELNRGRFPAT